MSNSFIMLQKQLMENRERIFSAIKDYPHVMQVGVGLKETGDEITSTLCYRVYVSEKKSAGLLKKEEIIPLVIDGFITDVISYGVVETIAMDNKAEHPLKGGVQIKIASYDEEDKRGVGTLGCLAVDNATDKLVGLTCEHVVRLNSSADPKGKAIGQPFRVVCCCFFERNIIGKVINAINDSFVDCAIIELESDIVNEISTSGIVNEIKELGYINGKAKLIETTEPELMKVIKRGAATGITRGIVVDIAFDLDQLLIAPLPPYRTFADFGDSGSLVLIERNNLAVGLLWGTKKDRFKGIKTIPDENPSDTAHQTTKFKPRVYGVVTPIDLVESALNITVSGAPLPARKLTFSVHDDDTNTFHVNSIIPDSTRQHFVTVKKGTVNNEIPDFILLKVSVEPAYDPINLIGIEWNSDNPNVKIESPGVGDDRLTAKINRNTLNGEKAMIGITFNGIGVGEKAYLWIVWSKAERFILQHARDENGDLMFNPGPTPDSDPIPVLHKITVTQAEVKLEVVYTQNFVIEPAEIFPKTIGEEAPDLKGVNTTDPPDVPDTDTDVFQKGISLKDGAVNKWDVSKSMRCKVHKYDSFWGHPPGKYNDMFPNYPSVVVVGNDDTSVALPEIELTPYSELDIIHGKLIYANEIIHAAPNNIGNALAPSVVEFRIHYRLFARLNLGHKWYIISEFAPWRMEWAYKKVANFTDQHGHVFHNVWQLEGDIILIDDSNVNFDDPFILVP